MNKAKLFLIKHIKAILLTIIALIVIVIFGFLLAKDIINKNNDSVFNEMPGTSLSYPISYINNRDASQIVSFPTIGGNYTLTNINLFRISQLKDFNLEQCSFPLSFPSVPVDTTTYIYNYTSDYLSTKDTLGSVIYTVFNNLAYYKNNDSYLAEGYSVLLKLFSGEITLESQSNSLNYENVFSRSCSDMLNVPMALIQEVEYYNTDKSYLMLFYGSNQSVVDHTYFPITAFIISKKGDDYSLAKFPIEYSAITNANHLQSCEITSQYGYKYINIFEDSGKQCIKQVLEQDLNKDKINSIVNQFFEVFKIN